MSEAYEMHGVWANGSNSSDVKGAWVEIREVGSSIQLSTPFNVNPYLTPVQARYLARKLHRLARLIEDREGGK